MTRLLVGKSDTGSEVTIDTAMLNRHGIIAGATGTGKTVTLQVLAEQFSKEGIPVFAADIKGDLSGVALPAEGHPKIQERLDTLGISNYSPAGNPVVLWDVFGKNGLPLRTTITEVGPVLLSLLLNCSPAQEGVLHIAFKVADEQGLLLLDLKDLQSFLAWLDENRKEVSARYGSVSTSSIGAIQRELLILEQAGGDSFFGEPAISIAHLMQKDFSGNGVINLLDATSLIQNPRIYTTFLLWLLSELFETLPEVGDAEKPALVFFFDEAHVLFNTAPDSLLEKVEQIVRLIRSKGVGIFFVTQHPEDVPDSVASQLATRVQHALRAFTPKEQQSLKSAGDTFRPNPAFEATGVLPNLKVGEALVSTLNSEGVPTVVERTLIRPPASRIGPLEAEERGRHIADSPLAATYLEQIDRESAYELLKERAELTQAETQEKPRKSTRQGPIEAFLKSILRSVGSSIGRQIARGILGSLRIR